MPDVRLFYRDEYVYDVVEAGSRSTFDIEKPRRILTALLNDRVITDDDVLQAPPVSRQQLLLVHTPAFLETLQDPEVLARLLLLDPSHPWDGRLLQPFLYASGGTVAAARMAVAKKQLTVNLGGGFHHAQADKAEGFCAIADVAIAIRALQASKEVERTLIVDLDYHHGNGNTEIFSADEAVFTLSIHGANWCWIDKRNNLDIELPPGTEDEAYLATVREHLPRILDSFRPDFVVYVAGADPFCEDMLGDFRISEAGMLERDRFVTEEVGSRALPMTVVTAGGYGPTSWRIPYNYYRWLLGSERANENNG